MQAFRDVPAWPPHITQWVMVTLLMIAFTIYGWHSKANWNKFKILHSKFWYIGYTLWPVGLFWGVYWLGRWAVSSLVVVVQ